MSNHDERVIEEFGDEWIKFNYENMDKQKLKENFNQYFNIFPWDKLREEAEGFDMGCGTGRWAQFVAPKVGTLNCIEPSHAIEVAKKILGSHPNVTFLRETTENCSLPPNSQDFGYCLGVLHHIPNTQKALNDCTKLLKKGAPFLVYLYYDFENKPYWFKFLWSLSDFGRKIISNLPRPLKYSTTTAIAFLIYLPFAKLAYFAEKLGVDVRNYPLADYRHRPFYQCKNDALDRFGTRLEQRFSRKDIEELLTKAGCDQIKFSDNTPFWCCVALKK